ncbi:SDR family NAD(P)-dependent oxidoreductase [Alkalicoccobacillus murimartini]|uniref:3-oxoacyl-[acyl-carrier protein] reductase n=1 Tax=Alkalicoccobacillus murimartini TaxID=171685 RepID=A0ABT9YLA9_9BACI|nr:SDR family oxidoreductase [Alkalicoccobacillus murimartini]MDQ0208260.1 3-oxoacyl-[acyl-carrier protein] reductase [Alkalicoccobacillus murimartini]
MNLHLQDRVVFITGGSKGIGRAIAEAFLHEGANVAVAARGKEELETCQKELGVLAIQADLAVESERERAFAEVLKKYGQIDILVNNVGGSNGTTIDQTELQTFQEAFDLNYFSAVHFSKLAIHEMKKQSSGSIINISSIFGREAGGKPTYNGAKAALISFTKSLADEVIKSGIRVNGVAPGSILHPSGNWQKRIDEDPEKMKAFVEAEIPAGRFGSAEEVANTVVFLASEKASWVVGATLNVDGGQSKSNF